MTAAKKLILAALLTLGLASACTPAEIQRWKSTGGAPPGPGAYAPPAADSLAACDDPENLDRSAC